MKALQMISPNNWEIVDLPRQSLEEYEVRVEISCTGICGSDLHVMAHPDCSGKILGHEFSGKIIEKGSLVSGAFGVGDRVSSSAVVGCMECSFCLDGSYRFCKKKKIIGFDFPGAFAQETIIDSRVLKKLPEDLSDQQGALLEPLCVGYRLAQDVRALFSLNSQPNILIIGDGPIALADLVMLRTAGFSNISLFGRHTFRMDIAVSMGARRVFAEDQLHLVEKYEWDICILAAKAEKTLFLALGKMHVKGIVFLQARVGSSEILGKIVTPEITLKGSFAYEDTDFDAVMNLIACEGLNVDRFITKEISFWKAVEVAPLQLVDKDNEIKVLIHF